eukprot:scaffold469_cov142-Isochrysis_galbana.AAC.3
MPCVRPVCPVTTERRLWRVVGKLGRPVACEHVVVSGGRHPLHPPPIHQSTGQAGGKRAVTAMGAR